MLVTPADELHEVISHDGRWLLYSSNESGRSEVYIRPFPKVSGGKWPISTDGGHSPLWSPSDSEVYYMNGANLISVPIRTAATRVIPDTPRVLFSGPFDITQDDNFDVYPDNQHFLMVEAAPDTLLHGVQVVLGWVSELERLTARNGTP